MSHRFDHEELHEAVRYLLAHGSSTVMGMVVALGWSEDRIRTALRIVSLPPTIVRARGTARQYVYRLHPDHAHLIDKRIQSQGRKSTLMVSRVSRLDAPMYPTGDPTHFDVDWLGRVVYRGPVRARVPRFEVSRNDEQSY